jgi:hypothetical protein
MKIGRIGVGKQWSRYLILGITFSFASTGSLLADEVPVENENEPVSTTPPPEDDQGCPQQVSLRGGFLYWFAKQNGLSFTNHSQSIFTTSDFTRSTLVHPDFEWKPGFELGTNYGFEDTFWSVDLDFIYYRGNARGHKSAEKNKGIFPALSFADNTLSSDYVTSAKTEWHLSTAILDATGAYEWDCNSWFSLTPSIALRDVWIREKIHATYRGGTYNAGSDVVRLRSRFYGVGPLLGLSSSFNVWDIFTLYGSASASYLAGWFHVRQKEAFLSKTRALLERDVFGGRWNGNFTLGVTLGTDFEKNTKSVELDLGFDYLFFTRQYEFAHGSQFSLPKRGKALILYGFHVSAEAHF